MWVLQVSAAKVLQETCNYTLLFDVLVELLNQVNENRKEIEKLVDNSPLWEDYELRGCVSSFFTCLVRFL